MKKIYLFALLIYTSLGFSQIINFPDANFKAKLLQADVTNTIAQDASENNLKIDTNNNNEIEVSEALAVFNLTIPNSNISDLTGVESFTNLRFLDCSYNNLTHFNYIFQNNFYPIVSHNHITNLTITGIMYAEADFSFNNIQTVTLNNVNAGGGGFLLNDNQITNIIFIGNNMPWGLYLNNNLLTTLDISNLTLIAPLHIINNPINKIIANLNTTIDEIHYQSNTVAELDLTDYKDSAGGWEGLSNQFYISNSSNLNLISAKNGYQFQQNCSIYMGENVCSSNFMLHIQNCPNLNYICVDEDEKQYIQNQINQLGLQNQVQINTYCTFTPGGTYYTINGNVKYDADTNGCDVLDSNITNQKFSITNGTETSTIIANNVGNYSIPVGAGLHTITPIIENPSNFSVSPTNVVVDFPTQISPFTQNFCVVPTSLLHQFDITIVPITPAIPGFNATYRIFYKNTGNTIEFGSIEFNFNDTVLDFVSTNYAFTSQTGGNIYWNFSALTPFETRTIDVVFNLNSPMETPSLNAGDILNFDAFIANNLIPFTTVADTTLQQTLVNSQDPNDKTCLSGSDIDPSEIGKFVKYLIRFENNGTFPAQNIVVKDMIDTTKFDISTLTPINGSHLYTTKITGNKVEFIFENINLPFDNATNDGFVVFKIKSLPTLQVNDVITNQASIYFDYNFPIITNIASSTYRILANESFENSNVFNLYPVPSSDILNISNTNQYEIQAIEIYNQLGQIVQKEIGNKNQINVSQLQNGMYFLKIKTENTIYTKQFIKE
jgi:hypothetical protein